MDGIKMYEPVTILLEHEDRKMLNWMINSNRFKQYLIENDKMTEEQIDCELNTEIGISRLMGKAIEIIIKDSQDYLIYTNNVL